MKQIFKRGINSLKPLLDVLHIKKPFLVCDTSFEFLNIRDAIESLVLDGVIFNQFTPNPLHQDANKGKELFIKENCDCIIAVGGGSSLDVAKCIKLDSAMDVPLIAIPTTAGTGSESTKHIVVYKDGKKESISSDFVIPNFVIFEPRVLETLPPYQKKCTLLDALCQGIESYWSINANKDSRKLSKKAIELIIANKDKYIFENDQRAAEKIMEGANYSGQAINLTQTTAPHAMSYKITSNYKLPHGHAVAICLPIVWETMLYSNPSSDVLKTFTDISTLFGCGTTSEAIVSFKLMLDTYNIGKPTNLGNRDKEIEELSLSVNPIRLKNNPIQFNHEQIKAMYERILN